MRKGSNSRGRVILYTKTDIAQTMGVTTQALSNWIKRYPDFPQPEYSDADGSVCLYTAEDVKAIHTYLTKSLQESNDRLKDLIKEDGTNADA